MQKPVIWTKKDNIAVITFDDPELKVNVLSTPVMKCLASILDEIEADSTVKGVLVTSTKQDIFIAGGDIAEIKDITTVSSGMTKAKAGQVILNQLANFKVPTIAVINGAALGGGLELALACQYRVAGFSNKVIMGLPEVRLGLIPGFGGTKRLPHVIGFLQTLTMIPAGKIVPAKKALKIKLVDKLFPDEILTEEAISFLKQIINKTYKKSQPKKTFLERLPGGKIIISKIAIKKTLKKTKGFYPAPIKAIEVISKGFGDSLEKALLREAEVFGNLVITETAKNLIKVFFLNEKYKHHDWGLADIKPVSISKSGIVGAGVMGGAIAWLISRHNIPVRMKDLNLPAVAKGLETARKMYRYPLKTKKVKPHEVDFKMGLISGTTSYKGFYNTNIVIEAVVENLKIKENVFKELSKITSPKTILATNTSSLPVTKLANASKDPSKIVGMHFFNPVDRMPLVEVITTEQTSKETTASIIAFARQLGKMPIVVKDCTGFLVNRLLLPYMNEAAYALAEGNSIEQIDTALTSFGMPMGPFTLADEIGIDICYKVAKILEDSFGSRMAVAPIIKEVTELGLFGKKTRSGFYIYKGKKKKVNPNVHSLITARKKTPSDILKKRLIYLMINEAGLILEEGIVTEPDTVDIGMIFGTGFPPFTAGLLRYADSVGIKNIIKDLKYFHKEFSNERFKPCNYLIKLAENNSKFYS